MPPPVILREVHDSDLPVFFEHQRDPEASRMAAFPAREHGPFLAHWAKIRDDPKVMVRTILFDGLVAGRIDSFDRDGKRLVGYWIGREFWGNGVATRALAEFLSVDRFRPLHAHVAESNKASIRVLEKCNFTVAGLEKSVSIAGEPPVDEVILRLR